MYQTSISNKMPGTVPQEIWLYRITHRDNLPHILRHGLTTAAHPQADPDFVGIGDHTLIAVRKDKAVPVPPGGPLSDYVPFYLGAHSPMLLQIKTGNQGVRQRPQSEIIYLISSVDKLMAQGCAFCFTDGHAWDGLTHFYHDPKDFDKIDWGIVKEKNWANTEEDIDRKRRKQAEILVKNHVPVQCIEAIVVYDEPSLTFAQSKVNILGLSIPVHLSTKHYY
jgi:hypothetical protein